LADILEVIYALLKNKNFTFEQLERKRKARFKERGGFAGRVFLEKTLNKGDFNGHF